MILFEHYHCVNLRRRNTVIIEHVIPMPVAMYAMDVTSHDGTIIGGTHLV